MSLPPGVINLTEGGPPRPPPPPLHPAGARMPQNGPPPPPPPPGRGPPGARPGPPPLQGRPPMGAPIPGRPQPPPGAPRPPVPMQHQPMPMQQVPMQQVPMQQMPMQQMPMQQMPMQQMPMQQMPIQPPRERIPPELRQRQLIEVSDLRGERMTEPGAREALSEYIVYRFEKVEDPNEIDVEGYPVKPTWENVRRVEVRDLSRQDIIRRIRELNDEGKTALQKKMDLTPAQQLQIEKAQDALEKRNTDKRYRFTLQQISSKLRKLHKDSVEYQQHMADREAKKVVVAKGRSSTSKSKKNLFETVTVMVYFKKEPRFEENALAMYHSKKNEEALILQRDNEARQLQIRRQMQEEQYQVEAMMHQREQMHHAHLHPPQQQFHQPMPAMPHKPHMPPIRPPFGGNPNTVVKVIQNDPRKGKSKTYTVPSTGSRSSRSTNSSDASWSDTEDTPDSSVTGSSDSRHGRRRHRSRGRSRSRSHSRSHRRGRPEEYGLKAPRRHTKHDHGEHYVLERALPLGRAIAAPIAPAALPMPAGRDFIGEEPFVPRRLTARSEAYGLEDADDHLTGIFNRRRTTLPARVTQRDVSFRTVGPQEVVRQRHEDDLDNIRRLRLESEVRTEDERCYEEEWAAERDEIERRNRRHMERRFRRPSVDREIYFRQGPRETYEEEAARNYMRVREGPAQSQFDNPFDALGRGTRRNSFIPAGYRG